ncbi:spore germination protein [Metabacillus sp. RGM 3146]|uniref:spore germination protein n=1 Tax=Metabacillus sp. RGM 3146 TaxID=3401092 RepID=UPI003B9BAAA6
MPAIVGIFKVNSIGTSSILHIGDVLNISPVSEVKTFSGAGSFVTGDDLTIYNQNSVTNTYDNNAVDQPIVGNL